MFNAHESQASGNTAKLLIFIQKSFHANSPKKKDNSKPNPFRI